MLATYAIFTLFLLICAEMYGRLWRRCSDGARRPLSRAVVVRAAVRAFLTGAVFVAASFYALFSGLWLVLGLMHGAVALLLVWVGATRKSGGGAAEAVAEGRGRFAAVGHVYRAGVLGLWVYAWWPVLAPAAGA